MATVYISYPHTSLILAPTSILANQLYTEAKRFLPEYFNISLCTQSNRLNTSNNHLIVATHAALFDNNIDNIRLLIIDEQHRFGTKQRNQLEKSKDNIYAHFLQFSATPIPRTLQLIQSSMINITTIEDMPFQKKISTIIIGKNDFSTLIKHISNEINNNHQIAIVYPLVDNSETIPYKSIEEAEIFWKKNFDNVYVTHGKDKQKEKILSDFALNGSILLTTTVIEVGISLPRLTTIVVVGAERFGLSTLHQLRGRVGRVGLDGWCYLYTNNPTIDRLKRFSKIKSGFDVAELDLELRNSGDIIDGITQSGDSFLWLDISKDIEIIRDVKRDIQKNHTPLIFDFN
jgi:ATP-dependent DNA helicase RecG